MTEALGCSEVDEKEKLYSQIEEIYGKEVYSRQTQNVAANRTRKCAECISVMQIVLTAVSSTGCIGAVLGQSSVAVIVATICSALALAINIYSRGAKLAELSSAHVQTANDLWTVEQAFISLLTDFNDIDVSEIRVRRDELLENLDVVYRKAPRTEDSDYQKAQKSLKYEEAQTFRPGEVDDLLPAGLRKKNQSTNV